MFRLQLEQLKNKTREKTVPLMAKCKSFLYEAFLFALISYVMGYQICSHAVTEEGIPNFNKVAGCSCNLRWQL